RSEPSTPRSSSGLQFQALDPFRGLRRERRGSALPSSHPGAGTLTTRQASLDATDRSVAPPQGLLTLGFDPARFQTEPPACYRASWQLPGPDSHRQATTSLCWIRSAQTTTSKRWAHSLCRCKFAGGSGSRWWSVYAALTSSGVVGSLPSYLMRLSRWRS